MDRPVLPGFDFFVSRRALAEAGGFSDVPNEDKALSRSLAEVGPIDVCPTVLVETSARRIEALGLVGTVAYYVGLDFRALRQSGDGRLGRPALAGVGLSVVGGFFQLYHGIALGHATALTAVAGFFGGALLYLLDVSRRGIVRVAFAFLAVQIGVWLATGHSHRLFGLVNAGLMLVLGSVPVYVL